MMGTFRTAYRLIEAVEKELSSIDNPLAKEVLEKLKAPKRALEDIIW